MALGIAAAVVAQVLVRLIALVTNLAFYQTLSLEYVSPAGNSLGLLVIVVPVIGALIIGFLARYGSKAIRGHGIPEAMEQVLTNNSRIPARVTLLKPLSAAISIGTGGPFGAEGPIIATGGALGSLIGQMLHITAAERKTLLAAGAAAGMAATFGSPVSAVLLVVELLLFELRPKSLIPVALASVLATGVRMAIEGVHPVFPMPNLEQPTGAALAAYLLIGALVGVLAVGVTRMVYAIEDAFERLPIHWMWWPALGAVAVGVVGYFAPRTLGVGYDNISDILSGRFGLEAVFFLCSMKFISWSISLGSGTSGGTLAPLFTIGGGAGALLGGLLASLAPQASIDVRVAALVGMAAIFAGASRVLLASAVFAFETTLQPLGLLPLLGGCAAAYAISSLLMKHTIMTERIARRGIHAPAEFVSDPLAQVSVSQLASRAVVTLRADDTLSEVRRWLTEGGPERSHQGFPVLDRSGTLMGVVTRRDLVASDTPQDAKLAEIVKQPVRFVYEDCTVRQAADHMVNHGVGRLPVMTRDARPKLVGILSRSDVLSAYRRRIEESKPELPSLTLPLPRRHDTPRKTA
jgi:H+/Cl- antiporter ClcA/CBS domain-containing protein